MTSDLPPLSKTHPTLAKYAENQGWLLSQTASIAVQSCTVDKAEHEALQKRELYYKELAEAEFKAKEASVIFWSDEVERLKKELVGQWDAGCRHGALKQHQPSFELGLAEGERRAMQRAHKLLDDSRITSYADDGSFCRAWNNKLWELKKKLGLSDKDDEPSLYECGKCGSGHDSATCADMCCQDKDDEVQP